MKTSLIIFGLIFLVVGGLLYFVPNQEIKADTTTTGNGDTDTRTSSAKLTVPVEWAYASAILGFILLILGLAISSQNNTNNLRKDSYTAYDRTVKSKENMGNGNRHQIVRERTEKSN